MCLALHRSMADWAEMKIALFRNGSGGEMVVMSMMAPHSS